jgi:hypothetical protein
MEVWEALVRPARRAPSRSRGAVRVAAHIGRQLAVSEEPHTGTHFVSDRRDVFIRQSGSLVKLYRLGLGAFDSAVVRNAGQALWLRSTAGSSVTVSSGGKSQRNRLPLPSVLST